MRKVLLTLAVLAVPRAAFACPVCFGNSDSVALSAARWGVITLLVIIVGVLAAFASFFVYLIRRSKFAEMPVTAESSQFGSDSQERIAQC